MARRCPLRLHFRWLDTQTAIALTSPADSEMPSPVSTIWRTIFGGAWNFVACSSRDNNRRCLGKRGKETCYEERETWNHPPRELQVLIFFDCLLAVVTALDVIYLLIDVVESPLFGLL